MTTRLPSTLPGGIDTLSYRWQRVVRRRDDRVVVTMTDGGPGGAAGGRGGAGGDWAKKPRTTVGRTRQSAGGRVRPRREDRFEVELKSHALPPRFGEI